MAWFNAAVYDAYFIAGYYTYSRPRYRIKPRNRNFHRGSSYYPVVSAGVGIFLTRLFVSRLALLDFYIFSLNFTLNRRMIRISDASE